MCPLRAGLPLAGPGREGVGDRKLGRSSMGGGAGKRAPASPAEDSPSGGAATERAGTQPRYLSPERRLAPLQTWRCSRPNRGLFRFARRKKNPEDRATSSRNRPHSPEPMAEFAGEPPPNRPNCPADSADGTPRDHRPRLRRKLPAGSRRTLAVYALHPYVICRLEVPYVLQTRTAQYPALIPSFLPWPENVLLKE